MTENRENGHPENGKVSSEDVPDPAERKRTEGSTGESARESAGESAGTSRPGEAGQPPRDPLGSVAEEALKLFEALQDRVMREVGKTVVKGGAKAGMSGLGQAFGRPAQQDVWSEAVAEHDPHGEEEYICRACPICRVKAASRESGGEVTDHLVAAGGELLAAFRQAFEALQRPASGSRSREREPRPSRVEHIDLG